jgi:hypothetical protein
MMPSKRKSPTTAKDWRPPGAGRPLIVEGPEAGPTDDFESLLGPGDDLWADEEEFEEFLAALRRWRKEDREGTRRRRSCSIARW